MPGAGPTAIVLAAGGSTRLGRDKLSLLLGGVPMLQRAVECYSMAPQVADVLVVLPPRAKENWSWLASLRVHLIENLALDELARDRVGSFCFILLAAKFKGATGCPVRPIALV